MVSISDLISCSRITELPWNDSPKGQWLFCTADESIYHIETIQEEYGFRDREEAIESGLFIPFFENDKKLALEAFFGASEKKEIEKMMRSKGHSFEGAAMRYLEEFDNWGTMLRWSDYYYAYLEKKAIEWCKENGISFSVKRN